MQKCDCHDEHVKLIERALNRSDSAYSLADDVHDDHENTKKEITKIKVSFAKASAIGSGFTVAITELIKFLSANTAVKTAIKTAISYVLPDVYAGN